MEKYIENNLGYNNAVDKYLLIPLEESDLGSDPEIEKDNIRIFLGSAPLCLNLLNLYLKQNKKIPAKLNIFDQYDVWIVTYSMSIIKTGGWQKIRQIGLEVKYPSGEDDPKVIIINNMPDTYFKKLGSGKLSFNAGLQLNGTIGAKLDDIKIINHVDLGFGGKLKINNSAKLSFGISFDVLSTKIISIGVGDTHGEWMMHRNEKPLLGDQIFCQTILTPKGISQLSCEARVSSVITGPLGSFPVRMIGPWSTLSLL